MTDVKKALYHLCIEQVKQRIELAKQAITESQEAAADETKSSAGDKYETGREMMQQETDRNMTYLNESNKLLIALNQINPHTISAKVENGSVVVTNKARFFLSVSAGTISHNGDSYYAISPASPIGSRMMGKKPGEEINLNGTTYQIIDVA